MSVEIQGAEQLARLSRQLKEAGDRELQKELAKAINRAVKPIKEAAKQSARATLPKRGGLAAKVAGGKFATRRRATANAAGVRIVATNLSISSLRRIDKGVVRHPVFGSSGKSRDEWAWVDQAVEPGWWSKPTEAAAPGVRRELEAAMKDIAAKIVRGV